MRARFVVLAATLLLTARPGARSPDILQPVSAVPAHLAGRFREAAGFQQAATGQYYVFDRRAHTVYALDHDLTSAWDIVQIGAEAGKILEPTAFSVEPRGSFAVADAPNNRERVQVFSGAGFRLGGFFLPGKMKARVTFDSYVLNGVGTLQYTGSAIVMNLPETGALITEYTLDGAGYKSIGALRSTGQDEDRDLRIALNTGVPLVDPSGGYYFVFQTGEPTFRRYDRDGTLLFERRIQGREVDEMLSRQPTTWARRQTADGELPVVPPIVRTAALDRGGNLWVSLTVPFTYVFDRDGDKIRTVQFRGAGFVSPNSLFFGNNGRLLISPGLLVFSPGTAAP